MDEEPRNLQDMLRAMAREVSQSIQRAIDETDVDEAARMIGVDPDRAREWLDSAGAWISSQTTGAEEREFADEPPAPRPSSAPARPTASESAFAVPAPHPLDMPTEEQGTALAALESGRWALEPGTHALTGQGEGPGPSDALGLARELRVRDWMAADGAITQAGRHALRRWLDLSSHTSR